MGSATSGFAQLSGSQRSLAASIGSLTKWSRINSPQARSEATAKARTAARLSWERKADPEGVLPPDELAAAVLRLRQAHQRLMTLRSAQARSARAGRAAA